eukprot:gnl/TRDRNA2_/TRDRNA2_176234_c4_seq2.p1 gnl/TRDRNA2_/TRDRNA2_176234_c4~~gnl/TRDRNA2_/TRDRNA2_176234_c4_seq2.p1  ORF type:complete len:313 (+),score=112.94 gnl/TRDRNA2_/TRDRNA2_176234_c4_seq2:97-939(+)
MIAKLQKEASEEASKKAYCDEEMAKTKAKHDELTMDIEKLTAKTDQQASASAQLKEEAAALQADLAALQKADAEMSTARKDEHDAFEKTKADLDKAISGVQQALEVLREYYGTASLIQEDKFDAFMQQPKPPVGHAKSGAAGGSIINILEVCESDFSNSLSKEELAESDAQTEYEKVSQENKIAKVQKEQDVKYKIAEAKSLDKLVVEHSDDRTEMQTELSAVVQYQSEINDQCVGKADVYEERKTRRENEIAGLKDATETLERQAAFVQSHYFRRVAPH